MKLQHSRRSRILYEVQNPCISFVCLASPLIDSRTDSEGQKPPYDRRMVFSVSAQVHGYPGFVLFSDQRRTTYSTVTLLSKQQSRSTKGTLATPQDPLHHVLFSPGYKDRIKCSKSRSTGHARQCWFDSKSKQAIKLAESFDHPAQIQDSLGVQHVIHTHETSRSHLLAKPTRTVEPIEFLRRSVGGSWRPKP